MTELLAVEPVLPEYRYSQGELTDALVDIIGLDPRGERLIRRIHAGCGVDGRHVALPLEQYAELLDFGQTNDAFIAAAVDLGAQALTRALDSAGLAPEDLDLIVSTTITGLAVPSLEARIAERVGLRRDVVRLPIVGLGCMAGAAGTARLHDLLAGRPGAVGALVSVELCSLTVQRGDASGANLVASGLFGDGAGAVVATSAGATETPLPRVVAAASRLYPGTQGVMGWDVRATGLRIVLGAEVPDLVRDNVGADVVAFLAEHGLTVADIGWWVCHPGGPKVIDALAETLGLPLEALALTTESLRTVGNLSSASVLHILRAALDAGPAPGSHGLMMAMGPGFSLEMVLLEAR
ncbi:isopalmitoylresorcinol synthase [Georgenia satyanarayanai]|uniref:Isopalmitoylresorcinol synthase n=1 Tax=Georgenia satyanarayanai TaxID=860221 RepID=A0A2Y9AIB2_9MICO|nr:3-oxoacyl-[acyl-carrier-protein] synthase III C-terminal domain-containing protein [Georgenia satyanarayanai]PYF99098.1 isopalmitoylresorcinol synthase [Georgenia satyanarayanai]SSA44060.1 isopalmitoylresorcinol synthase [Georgenia satyanarayanai]